MGTIADFYVGRGAKAEWVGSVAWSGDPAGIMETTGGPALFNAADEAQFREALRAFLAPRSDAASPSEAWPWPWPSSADSNYVYAFDDGKVWSTQPCRTYPVDAKFWFDPLKVEPEDAPRAVIAFPDMTARMLVHVDAEESMDSGYAMGGRP